MALNDYIRGLQRRDREGALGSAGQSYLQNNFDPRWASLSMRDAQAFDSSAKQAAGAIGADPGSLAARNSPFDSGSIAARQFPSIFGDAGNRNAFSRDIAANVYNGANGNFDPNIGLKRRSLYNGIGSLAANGDPDGS